MSTPECFGKMWSSEASECAGGYDPFFVGPNGTKTRPRCDFYESCKTRTVVARANQQQRVAGSLVPPQALVRPPAPISPYQQQTQYQPAPYVPRPIQQQPPPQPQQYTYPHVVMPPVQMMPTSYAMPAYLSTPETRQEDESFWHPLGREIFRGLGKALGHSLAHFFDVTILKPRKDEEAP